MSTNGKSLQEWVELYEAKTGEKFERDKRFELFYLPDKGFCEVGQTNEIKMLIINQLCGDAKFWRDKVTDVARHVGIGMCGTWCIRKEHKAYIRLFGYRIVKEEKLPDGLSRYSCVHKDTGKEGWMAPAFRYRDSGTQAYFITWVP